MKKTTVFENSLIWFGAGVSIAEILTGTYFAPLGFTQAVIAIVIGHIIGGILLFLAGYMGAKTKLTAMETVKIGFGKHGGLLFAFLNVLQLVGWTAIMIYDGALAASSVFATPMAIWALIIGGLILLWIAMGIENLGKINTIAMAGLFILTILLSKTVFSGETFHAVIDGDALTFGAAIELAVVMPLSWLPVISDYTRTAAKPLQATWSSVIVYNLVSIWMYIIGMGMALYTQETDFVSIMVKASLGISALLIIVFSTVTTTFLDAISAGFSSVSISKKLNAKYIALGTTVLGTVAAMIYPMDNIMDFLFYIGSVFAPMIGVLIVEFYIFKRSSLKQSFNICNLVVWAIGFGLYRYLLDMNLPIGSSVPDIIATALLAYIAGLIVKSKAPSLDTIITENK